jgi:hypothetical protein
MKKNKPLYMITNLYMPEKIINYTGDIQPDYTVIGVHKLVRNFWGLWKSYKQVAGYRKAGNCLVYPNLKYWKDVFYFDTIKEVVAHLHKYEITEKHEYFSEYE